MTPHPPAVNGVARLVIGPWGELPSRIGMWILPNPYVAEPSNRDPAQLSNRDAAQLADRDGPHVPTVIGVTRVVFGTWGGSSTRIG